MWKVAIGVHEHGDGDEQHGHEAEADHAGALGEQHLVAVCVNWISGVGAWLWRGRVGQVRGSGVELTSGLREW